MQREAAFRSNGIVLISAPRDGEEGTARRMAEDLHQLAISEDFVFHHTEINSKRSFLEFFQSIKVEIEKGFRPILHFDMHGDREQGLEIGPSSEVFGWEELTKELRSLNTITKNNLTIIITACYGFYIIKPVSILEPCPFFLMIGPPDRITVGDIEDTIASFYAELMKSKDVIQALTKLDSEFNIFSSEHVFFKSFTKYIHEACSGKGGRERRERLLTEALVEKSLPNTRYVRRKLRRSIKSHLKPTPELMERYLSRFLHGRESSFTFADVMAEVAKMKDSKH